MLWVRVCKPWYPGWQQLEADSNGLLCVTNQKLRRVQELAWQQCCCGRDDNQWHECLWEGLSCWPGKLHLQQTTSPSSNEGPALNTHLCGHAGCCSAWLCLWKCHIGREVCGGCFAHSAGAFQLLAAAWLCPGAEAVNYRNSWNVKLGGLYMPRNIHNCSLMLNLICSMLCKYGWLCNSYKLITKTSSCMQRTAGSLTNTVSSHLRSQGEILLRGSAKGLCLPPLWEDTLGITASLTGELWLEHMGVSLHPCQPQWEAQSPFLSHHQPVMVQRWGMHWVWILGTHLLFWLKRKRKLADLGAVPERGHPELQGSCNGVTHWRAGHQDLGWCVLHAFWEKYPGKMRDTFWRCLCLAVALGSCNLLFSALH